MLKGATLIYSTYDLELYALIIALWNGQHYLLPKKIAIQYNHEYLKHLLDQVRLNERHAKWTQFLKTFSYIIEYKNGNENMVAYALSRKHVFLSTFSFNLLDHECSKALYPKDPILLRSFKIGKHGKRNLRDISFTENY